MQVKVIMMGEDRLRIVSGDLLSELDFDWSIEPLDKLNKYLIYAIQQSQRNLPSTLSEKHE